MKPCLTQDSATTSWQSSQVPKPLSLSGSFGLLDLKPSPQHEQRKYFMTTPILRTLPLLAEQPWILLAQFVVC